MNAWRVLIGAAIGLALLTGCEEATSDDGPTFAPDAELNDDDRTSGYAFLTPEVQALQDDAFANPGYLWVDRGAELFATIPVDGAGEACASCHGADGSELVGVAATYPAIDLASGDLLNLEGRINQCRRQHQDMPSFAYESEELLSLTAFVANLSNGMPMSVSIDGPAAAHFDVGRDYFYARKGQMNLACSQCHTDRWGMMLRGDTISQGHSNGFPTYRLAWQTLGSLHRRLKDCDEGVRAEPYLLGSETYVALELYLAARSAGLPMEAPSVRR